MAKKIFFFTTAIFLLQMAASAQALNEWVNQKSTQKKYLLQQIAALQVYIARQTLQSIKEANQFSVEEIEYCKKVLDALLDDCIQSVTELLEIITPDKLQMTDDERLVRIDKLYGDMQDKFTFCNVMSEDIGLLALQRLSEQIEINRSKLINGIK